MLGANFRIFRMKPRDTKIITAKILTIEIVTSNFERVIKYVEAASASDGGISSLLTAPVDLSTPVSLTLLWGVRQMKVSQVHREQQ